ncbi:MAG: NAD(P)/FAD-dependent oxidoreductase [Leptospiraceae bacterium]|nr:NAD(P)/FAD-dependent oxidoreductase [Leptospiraceae bacterium]MCP5496046.1 NAD(P)/FAD-dependent oxidoreductase [Leptospiraceae bacterium]
MSSDIKFDAIVIGSGIGGLTVASILSKIKNYKVLVLERHFKAGGFTHEFSRQQKFHWDVGLHYVGEMEKGNMMRGIFNFITDNQVKWNKMLDPFEKFVYPDFIFDVYSDAKKYENDLIQKFPNEALSIQKYFKDLSKVSSWARKKGVIDKLPNWIQMVYSFFTSETEGIANSTTLDYLNNTFQDAKLKAVLVSLWGDYGLPPAMSAFMLHASIAYHYLKGGYYPEGGAGKIAESILPIIQKYGGDILINCKVEEIIIENGKAVGVRAEEKRGGKVEEKRFYADHVFSNTGAATTYCDLLQRQPGIETIKSEIDKEKERGYTTVTLYIGLKDSPEALGFKGENYWIYTGYDHDEMEKRKDELLEGKPVCCFLSFPSLKTSGAKAHTAEIIAPIGYKPFEEWSKQPWKKRDYKYYDLKEKMATALIGLIEERFPGFQDLIEYYELSTPLSVENFTGHYKGNIYGVLHTLDKEKYKWIGSRTPIPNLYLCGTDVSSHGIIGAMMGGVISAAELVGFMKIFKEAGKYKNSL